MDEDQPQILSATLSHPEQVASYQWSEGSKVLGTKSTLSTVGLSVGVHTIILTVTDKNGITSSDEIVVTIDDALDEGELVEDSTFVGTTKGAFSVNQGTANYSLKIDVPPGVAGMEPKLSLNYSSGAGNGYMGVGWSIGGVSAVTRCAQTRAVDGDNHKFGVNYNSNDRFCLDGQRLIVVNGLPYGADGAEYRTEIDSYSKIISKGDYYGGPRYFEVHTKSGLTHIYGQTTNTYEHTRVGHALKAWKIDKIRDSYSNAIAFHYSVDISRGIHYLSSVTYADNRLDFMYENRTDVLKGYHAGYPFGIYKRLKTVVVKTGATEVRRYKIAYTYDNTGQKRSTVTSIIEQVAQGDLKRLDFSTGGTFENSQFNYRYAHATDILANGRDSYGDNDKDNKWYIYTPDVNGDGLSDICYRSDEGIKCFVNNHGTFSTTADIDTTICANHDNSYGGCESRDNWRTIRFVDMDADGLADLVYRSDAGMRIWKSTGSGFTYLNGNTILSNSSSNSSENNWKYIFTPDINGDGLADLCYRADTGLKCYKNQGNAYFSNYPTINTSICANGSTSHGTCNNEDNWDTLRFMDMDRDGLQDLLYRSDSGIRIWKSRGDSFGVSPSYSSNLIKNSYRDLGAITVLKDEWKYIYTPDMNGDGLPDLCYRSYEGIKCYTNYGGRFSSVATINTSICAQGSTSHGTCNDEDNYKTIRFMDTDADGLPDLTYRSDSGMRIWANRGNALAPLPKTSSILANYHDEFGNNDYDNWSTKAYFDVNGDGIQDLYYRSDSGIIFYTNQSRHALVRHINNFTDERATCKFNHPT